MNNKIHVQNASGSGEDKASGSGEDKDVEMKLCNVCENP
jgi:hypothetical protein